MRFSPLGTHPDREAVLAFLSNQFNLVPDVGAQIGQAQGASMHLASGLATWVPRLQHPDQTYWIEATAGSGKTQLALTLLREAVGLRQRARYVCFNRPLADHLQTLAPAQADVTNFHQLCREHAERAGLTHYPVDYQDYASPELEYADLTADNAVAAWADLDLSSINLEVPELGPEFDIDLLEFQNYLGMEVLLNF